MAYELTFNAAQLLKEPRGSSRRQEIHAPVESLSDLDPEVVVRAPMRGSMRYLRTAYGVLATGRLRTRVEVACVRCLEPTEVDLELVVEEEYRPIIDVYSGHFLDSSREVGEELRLDDHHILDLTEVVRQTVIVSLPWRPLCTPDCPGLCAVCGEPLRQGEHEHPQEGLDPRLSALRDLLT